MLTGVIVLKVYLLTKRSSRFLPTCFVSHSRRLPVVGQTIIEKADLGQPFRRALLLSRIRVSVVP